MWATNSSSGLIFNVQCAVFRLLKIFLQQMPTVLCACGRGARARPPRSTARCGWCLCGGRPLRSWLWTGSGPGLLQRCSLDLSWQRDQTGMVTECARVSLSQVDTAFRDGGRETLSDDIKCNVLSERRGRLFGILTSVHFLLSPATLKPWELTWLATQSRNF